VTALLIVTVALAGCGSVETKDDSTPTEGARSAEGAKATGGARTPAVTTVSQDPPATPVTAKMPEFGDPRPPVAVSAKGAATKEDSNDESTREKLLDGASPR
jgi:hypothetical protein